LELSPHKKDRPLTRREFDRLLAFLSPDLEKAAKEYLKIRNKMIFFFRSRGCRAPEDCADVTESRVGRKLIEGIVIRASDPTSFFYGVANHVLQEYWSDSWQKSISIDDPSSFVQVSQDPFEDAQREADRLQLEREMECLEKCLEKIPFKNRDLILRYYQGETSVKINNRKKLAEELGIQLNALRLQAFRIREKLQICVSNCIKRLTNA
jgi:DNA-directed RNA polymerase specialized sigma24 family protein